MRRAGCPGACAAGATGCPEAGGALAAGASGAAAGGAAASIPRASETGASAGGSVTATWVGAASAGAVGAKEASGGAKAGASGAAGAASTTGGGGATATGGRTGGRCWATVAGVIMRGARSGAGGAAGGATVRAAGGRFTIARGGGGAGVSTVSLRARIAFIASPGLEILERSIFGRNSSPPARWRAAVGPPLNSRRYLRTRSASSSSTELEWVFFSVTPTFSRTSRTCLLFTSSSRARSLIRIFIRRSVPYSHLLTD